MKNNKFNSLYISSDSDDEIYTPIYSNDSWQYKLISNKFFFKKDNISVLKIYNLFYLYKMFLNTNNFQEKDKLINKMIYFISDVEWFNIKSLVKEI